MSEDFKTFASTCAGSTADVSPLEKIQATMRDLDVKHLSHIRTLCEGTVVIQDHSGIMVHPDGYVVVVGERLYKKLKGIR